MDFRGHLREGPFKQGVGVRQNGGIVGRWFLWRDMVNCYRGCGRRCCLCRLRLRLCLCLGLLPGRQLCCIRVVGPLPGRARLRLQLQVLRLHRLVQLPVTINPGLEMVVEQYMRFTVAAVP
jgi:hypothetical protein